MNQNSKFKTKTVEDTELVYSLLKEKYPDRQIEIEFNDNTKEYTLSVTNNIYKEDPEIPVDLQIKVIYGDSVTGDTPLLLRNVKTMQINIKTIKSIFDESNIKRYPGFKIYDTGYITDKQYSLSCYQVWTDKGWSDIRKVIRHKTNKKIYRVLSSNGCVDVTEDHSLCTSDLKIIKPIDVKIGVELLHSYPIEFLEYKSFLSIDEAKCLGFFHASGYCNVSVTNNGYINTWSVCSDNYNTLIEMKILFEKCEKMEYYIYNSGLGYKNYKLSPVYNKDNQQRIDVLHNKYRKLFYDDLISDIKKVPDVILNAEISIKNAYFDSYRLSDCVLIHNYACIVRDKLSSTGIYYIAKSLNYSINIEYDKAKTNFIFKYEKVNDNNECSEFKNIVINDNEINIIKYIDELGYTNRTEFVYDLETETGRFNSGVGELVVFNTDSVFLSLKYNRDNYKQNREDTFKMATLCGDNLTHKVFKRPPIEMEFEKVFHPFILLSKKRYIGRKYDNMKDPFEMTKLVTSGIALTRRDYCKMVKKCYKEIIEVIMEMKENDINVVSKGIDIFKKYINDILNYNIKFDDLIVSALLAKSYKTRPVHLILAEKLKARNEEVQIGSRIPYIYIESNDKTKIKSELGEDPEYAKLHNLKFNRLCYLEQLSKPILSFLCIVLKDNEERCDELIDYVNSKIIELGGKKLKNSDFKIFSEE
jgi:hypothetical protein